MGILKEFFNNVFRDGAAPAVTQNLRQLDRRQLESHLAVSRYGKFELTDAIRPSFDLKVVPQEAFRREVYYDNMNNVSIPVLLGSVSKEKLFDTFMELLDSLGNIVDVVLESSHDRRKNGHIDFLRENIDLPVLKSVLYDYEDLLLNDGCTGIAVLNSSIPHEVQFDEHKLLIVYGEELNESETIFHNYNVYRNESVRFITEAEHVHSSRESYRARFNELKLHLGMDY
ncbi:MAG: hypothetical protein Q4C95_01715 [Planctomycetia bacterium]|nr:hypothetical protein [Planctomycetia bacterium]